MDGDRDRSDLKSERPNDRPDPKPLDRVERHIKRRLFEGFIVLVPLLVTFLVLRVVIDYVDRIFIGDEGGLLTRWLGEDTPLNFPGIGFLFAIVLLYLIGVLVSGKAGQRAVSWQNAVLTRVPVVKGIYGLAKQAADAMSSPMGSEYRRVVFVEWPRPGFLALGFVTSNSRHPLDPNSETLLVVYIPTVPNPTSGNLAFIRESEVIETNITMEEAMKIVFSGGTVLPDGLGTVNRVNAPQLPPNVKA